MNITELKELIKSSLNINKGTFELETEGLSTGLEALGADYLADGSLKLSNASIEATDESITVKGTGVDMPFKGLSVKAEFYILEENAALELTATTGNGWTFEKSIPAFKGTIANDIRFTADPAPAFYLLSDERDGRPENLTFEATIDLDAMTGGLKDLLGISNEEVGGPIVLTENATKIVSINLKGKDIKSVNIGVVDNLLVKFGITSHTFNDAGNKTKAVVPCITLATEILFKGANDRKYPIPLSVSLTNFSSFIRFNAEIDQLINASLTAVADLAGKIDLSKTLPSDFKVEEYLTFTNLYIDYNIGKKKVDTVGLELESNQEWVILNVKSTGRTFKAENIVLQFTVFDPLSEDERAASLYIGGEITINTATDKAAIVIGATYPDFNVDGCLADGSVLKISDFIKDFVGESAEVPDLLNVDELNFSTNGDDYSFEINLNGYWPINTDQSLSLLVDDLNFNVEYISDTQAQAASFSGMITIDNVEVTVTADYSEGEGEDEEIDKGWIFTGSTGEGQLIPMGDFITYLAKTFKAGDPPNWVKTITLSDLNTEFNTQTKYFEFGVTGNVSMGDDELSIVVDFAMSKEEEGYQKELSGEITIGNSVFTLHISSGTTKNELAADWTTAGERYLQFGDITAAFGLGALPAIPDGFDLALKKAALMYNFDDRSLMLSADSAHYGKSVFVAKVINEKWTYVFGINFGDITKKVALSQLPLVGPDLASVAGDVGLEGFRLIGISNTIDTEQVEEFNKLIGSAGSEYPTLPGAEKELLKAVYVVVDLNLGKDNDYKFEFNTAKNQLVLLPANGAGEGQEKWIDLQKNIGPIHFNRAGVGYKDGRVSLLLDAALVFSAFKIEMRSLGVSNPLTSIAPEFELSGINISYDNGPVQISGGFLKSVWNGNPQYSGTAAIGVQNFRLSALGSYAKVNGEPSLFVFAMLSSPPPGGPPCFFVTGLAGGFGYNRGLKLPTIDTVADFPLVKGFVPGKKSDIKSNDPNEALKKLNEKGIVPVAIGQNWVAAGVQFTSFQLVLSYALLSVEFGTNFEIGIVGMSSVSVPPATPSDKKPETPVAYAQLALNARILPEKGEVAVEAKLTPASYILSEKCVLAGGFAFYLWTAPSEHEGDFVVTLGGYHPDFVIPAHYPKVPRLSFNWEVSKEVLVKGALYFALTPTCLMAGGSLEATFNSGNLKAWFIMGADFLIAWKPYYYRAHMYISFGVSYTFELDLAFTTITETITVSLGADLQIWGPDFSGIARIHLWIISFDISFGSAADTLPEPISWEVFKESFLPPSKKTEEHLALYGDTDGQPIDTDTYCYSKLVNGLVEDMKPKEKDGINWIVSRDQTIFESYTICPAKKYSIIVKDKGNKAIPCEIINNGELDGRNVKFGVGMVNVENDDFHSKHEVIINLDYEIDDNNHEYEAVAILRSVPKSLWEKRVTGFGDEARIKNVLVGFRISPKALAPKRSLPVDLKYFKFSPKRYQPNIVFATPVFVTGPDDKRDGIKVLKETINAGPAKQVRESIITALKKRSPKFDPKVNVEEIAAHAEDFILAPPVLSYTYWKKSA